MFCSLERYLAALELLKFESLSNVQTVGIGLYLAMAVIQVVTDSGLSGVRRRAAILEKAVRAARLRGEITSIHSLHQEIGSLEIGLQAFSRTILVAITFLFAFALVYFVYCTIFHTYIAGLGGALFIIIYYLFLPVLIFVLSSILIARKCAKVLEEIRSAEQRYKSKVFG